jgi:hypothetical protein
MNVAGHRWQGGEKLYSRDNDIEVPSFILSGAPILTH